MLPFLLLLAGAACAVEGGAVPATVLPYAVHKRALPNGLDIIVIETPEFKDMLSFNTMALAGSGREHEKGRTGLAHLFEHILFRHRYAASASREPTTTPGPGSM